jgi:hypothetical protein
MEEAAMGAQFVLRTIDGRDYVISGSSRIGREADCQIRYNDPAISRHHATVSVEQDALFVTDDNSANGVFVNGRQIQAGRPHRLRPSDRLRLGNTQIEFEVMAAATAQPALASSTPGTGRPTTSAPGQTTLVTSRPARPWLRIACASLIGGVLLIGFVLIPLAYFLLGGKLPGLLTPLSTKVSILTTSTPPPLLEPKAYADSNEELASAVAELNQAEIDFIRAATGASAQAVSDFLSYPVRAAPRADELDNKLCQVAANALNVATLADSLARTSVAQDGGSDNADQIASQYTSIAQMSAAMVLDVQDLRPKLTNELITPPDAAQVIAGYGARLWNPVITASEQPAGAGEPGSALYNPFTAYLADPGAIPPAHGLGGDEVSALLNKKEPLAWVATSSQKESKTFTLPPASANAPVVDRADSVLLDKLKTASGQQAEADSARQFATAIIQAGSGANVTSDQSPGGEVIAEFASAMAVASPTRGETPSRTMPAFPKGNATAVTENGDAGDVLSSLININNQMEGTVAGQVPVNETQPLVGLTISNVVVAQVNKRPKDAFSTFEADILYTFDVEWQGTMTAPQFELDCAGSNHFEITATGGRQHVSAKAYLILYPGAETAYCYASHNGNTWGSASSRFLIGDADGATQRANQVETDSVSLNLTLTADAVGTLHVEQTSAAATRAVVATENAVATEVYGTQTAEFIETVTKIARETEQATPQSSETPLPTPTFEPVLVDTLAHPGNVFAVNTNVVLKSGRLYRICLSGTVNLTTGPVRPSDMDSVNGIRVPLSGCVTLEGSNAVATISCGHGDPDPDNPGGFGITVYDLGPW